MVTSTRAFLTAVIVSLAALAALLQLPAPVQAQSSPNIVPAGPAVSGAHQEVLALAAIATTGPTTSGALDGPGASAEAPRSGGGSAATDSAGLSALAVLMLVLIVAGTALMGSRKS